MRGLKTQRSKSVRTVLKITWLMVMMNDAETVVALVRCPDEVSSYNRIPWEASVWTTCQKPATACSWCHMTTDV